MNTRFCNFIIQCLKHGPACNACEKLPKVDYYGTKSFHHRGQNAQTMSALKKIYRDGEGHEFQIIPIKGRLSKPLRLFHKLISPLDFAAVEERRGDQEDYRGTSKKLKVSQSEGLNSNMVQYRIAENMDQRVASLEAVQSDQALKIKELEKKTNEHTEKLNEQAMRIEELGALMREFGDQAEKNAKTTSDLCSKVAKFVEKEIRLKQEMEIPAPFTSSLVKPDFNVKIESDVSSAAPAENLDLNPPSPSFGGGERAPVSTILDDSVTGNLYQNFGPF